MHWILTTLHSTACCRHTSVSHLPSCGSHSAQSLSVCFAPTPTWHHLPNSIFPVLREIWVAPALAVSFMPEVSTAEVPAVTPTCLLRRQVSGCFDCILFSLHLFLYNLILCQGVYQEVLQRYVSFLIRNLTDKLGIFIPAIKGIRVFQVFRQKMKYLKQLKIIV